MIDAEDGRRDGPNHGRPGPNQRPDEGRAGLYAVVHGDVQGVGFRWHTRRRMAILGVSGSARNMDDGTVHVEATGDADALRRLAAWLRSGDPPGRVTRVDIEPE